MIITFYSQLQHVLLGRVSTETLADPTERRLMHDHLKINNCGMLFLTPALLAFLPFIVKFECKSISNVLSENLAVGELFGKYNNKRI